MPVIQTYDIYIGDLKVGNVKDNESFTEFKNSLVLLEDVSGFIGTKEAKGYGLIPTPGAITYDVEPAKLWGLYLPGYVKTVTQGALTSYFGGTQLIDLKEFAKPLVYHPSHLPVDNRTNDITIFKASPNPDGLRLTGSQNAFQQAPLNYIAFPDENRAQDERYYCIGDPTITDTPIVTWIQASENVHHPAIQATVFTLAPSQREQFNLVALYGDITSTATAAINQVAGLAADRTDTTIPFDTLAGGVFLANNYYLIGNEKIFVKEVDMLTDTTGTLEVVRAVCKGILEAHLDDAVITMVSGQSLVNHTKEAIWATSNGAVVGVGNTYLGTKLGDNPTKKGLVYGVAVGGPANITATHSSVQSGNLEVTVI